MKKKSSFFKLLIASVALAATVQNSFAELILDGATGIATAPTSTAYDKGEAQGYTVECWFNTTTTSGGTLISRIPSNDSQGFRLYLEVDGQIGYRNSTTSNQAGIGNIGSNH